MPLENCFGDLEEEGDGLDEQELITIGRNLTPDQMELMLVESIHLVGSYIAGCHQELRFVLTRGPAPQDVAAAAAAATTNTAHIKEEVPGGKPMNHNVDQREEKEEEPPATVTFFLRISRINATDTYELMEQDDGKSAEEEDDGATTTRRDAFLKELPTLKVLDNFPKTTTLQDVYSAFEKARNLFKRYDQGDCHSLSQTICDLLVPGSFPAELDW